MKRRLSTKKTIATLGSVVIHTIGVFAVYKDPNLISAVLWPLCVYDAALFGIKKFGGYFNHKEEVE